MKYHCSPSQLSSNNHYVYHRWIISLPGLESKVAKSCLGFFEFFMDMLTTMKPSLVWAWLFKINHANRRRFNFLANNVFNVYPCLNDCFAFDNRVFRSCDRYLNSGANMLKLTKVVWLYLATFDPC